MLVSVVDLGEAGEVEMREGGENMLMVKDLINDLEGGDRTNEIIKERTKTTIKRYPLLPIGLPSGLSMAATEIQMLQRAQLGLMAVPIGQSLGGI